MIEVNPVQYKLDKEGSGDQVSGSEASVRMKPLLLHRGFLKKRVPMIESCDPRVWYFPSHLGGREFLVRSRLL